MRNHTEPEGSDRQNAHACKQQAQNGACTDSTSQKECTVFRNPLFSFALLLASTLCATSAFAQSGTRGGYSSPAFPSGSYRSSQPIGGNYQGSSVRAISGGAYAQGQTCANGSCSARSAAAPVVSTAIPVMNHSTYSVIQYPVVMGSSMTSSSQPIHNAYYPAQSSTSYSPYTMHYGSTQAFSSTPISSCSGSVTSRSCR